MADRTSSNNRTQYWKEQINAWQASGQSQQDFCRSNELSYTRFGYWLRKYRERGDVAAPPRRASGFVPVITAPPGNDLTIRLPNGIELHGITAANLSVAEQLLSRL